MFGHDAVPSKIYSFGAREPVTGLEIVREQMHRAHQYRNALVELERERRVRVDAALVRLSPELAVVETNLAKAEVTLEAARSMLLFERSKARSKQAGSTESRKEIETAKMQRKALAVRRKELRTALFASESWIAIQHEINTWAKATQKQRRAESGLFWGTYLQVEQSMMGCRTGAPPKFMRWTGDGKLSVQLQGGMSVEEVETGTDTRIQIVKQDGSPTSLSANPDGSKFHDRRLLLRMRVGSNGRAPIWAEIQFILHRPLPADARLKWVYLMRKRVATHDRWSVCLVIAREQGWAQSDAASTGNVGIDVGWRVRPDGGLRVAYWVGEDGYEGELTLPPAWLAGRKKVQDLQSIRDKNFNEIRTMLTTWMKSATVPEWLTVATEHLSHWRAPSKLARLTINWRTLRFDGDVFTFDAVEAWRKQDRHLYDWERNQDRAIQNQRLDTYRKFACEMRRRYKTTIVEDMDLRDFHVLPQPEELPEIEAVREHVRDAACSILRRCLQESMSGYVEAPAPRTTMECADCGIPMDFDRVNLMVRCPTCGKLEDQDRRAARNLLARGSERPKEPEPLANVT